MIWTCEYSSIKTIFEEWFRAIGSIPKTCEVF